MKKLLITGFLVIFWAVTFGQQSWKKTALTSEMKLNSELLQSLQVYELLTLTNLALPKSMLNEDIFLIDLPLGNGVFETFKVSPNNLLPNDLKTKYPAIRAFNGISTSNPTHRVKLEHTYKGISAMITLPEERIYLQELALGSGLVVVFPYTSNKIPYDRTCEVVEPTLEKNEIEQGQQIEIKPIQQKGMAVGTLRTFRLALAATAEYTARRGNTKASALSSMTTSMNRVNQVYEDDFSITMVFVSGMDTLIYTNSTTDPYTNNNGPTMLGQNQNNIDAVIKTANYDIGHVFSTGGGGIASLRSPCNSSRKAQGVTGSPSPTGDPFDIDYVAHEMGHQFGCNHTFNGTVGSCSGNRNGNTAYEPGSGVTVMGYAGICGTDDIANNSIPYFHSGSYDEAISFVSSASGNCASITTTGNTPPVVNAGATVSIPRSTPFVLTGSATDVDGDPLIYCWDQMDVGTQGPPQDSLSTTEPIFRSFNATTSAIRFFPQESDVRLNKKTKGEVLPAVARELEFRLVARDLRTGGGELAYATRIVNVTDSDPFRVLYPVGGSKVPKNTLDSVVWQVGKTNIAPINCQLVNIYLSQDAGKTFTLLSANQPNTGKAMVQVPDVESTTARYKVESVGNIFYTVNTSNFQISTVLGIHNNGRNASLRVYPNPAQDELLIESVDLAGNVRIRVMDVIGKTHKQILVQNFNGKTLVDISDLHSGLYFIQLETNNQQTQVVKITKK